MTSGIKYVSLGDTTGYAVAAKAYVRALVAASVPLTWAPMMPGQRLGLGYDPYHERPWAEPDLAPWCNRPLAYDTVVLHTVPDYFPYWLERERVPGRRILGYTVFELDRLPLHWPGILNRLDGVLVPCQWNRETFRASGVTVPIHVIPHLRPHDGQQAATEMERAALLARLGAPQGLDRRQIFFTVGTWTARKSMDRTLRAFLAAFTADDPVVLIIKTGARDLTNWHRRSPNLFRRTAAAVRETVAALCSTHEKPALVRLIDDETLPDGEMRALFELGDVFASLTRCEGFGLGAFEAAARGKPVVMTGHGGQLDFLRPDYTWLVDSYMVPVSDPSGWQVFCPGSKWPEASLGQAARMLREIAADPAAARARAAPSAAYIAERFSAAAIMQAYRAVLEIEQQRA